MDEEMPHGIAPTEEDVQAFFIAIKSGSIEHMKTILEKHTSSISNKLESQQRQPPLYFAAMNSDEEVSLSMVEALVDAGANPNFRDANEQTIMFYICRDGKAKLAKYLMQLGCRIDQADLYGQTPIFYVANVGSIYHRKQNIFNSVINHVDELAKQTPLYYAARKGHLEMCKGLIERGCNIMHIDSQKKTAADYARKNKFQETAEYLSLEIKKIKDLNRSQNQIDSSNNGGEALKKKKKDNVSVANVQKNAFKITVMNNNGELHDLTEEELREVYRQNPQLQTFLSNPDAISQQTMETAIQNSWEKSALKILNQVWKVKGAYYFYDPVDPVKYGVLDYYEVIANPMDMNAIKKKLNFNAYDSPQEYLSDMRLVWNNCYEYNGDDHEISLCAKQMEKSFEQAVKEYNFQKFVSSNMDP